MPASICNFDHPPSREGTHTEKYDRRFQLFGSASVEPLWVADMDLPSPSFLAEALRRRAAHSLYGYTVNYDGVLDAIAFWMRAVHDMEISREAIRLSPSVVTSMVVSIQALTRKGDGVIVLSPVYGPFFTATEQNERRVIDCPLQVQQGRHHIDFKALETRCREERPALLLLCNPHNPGGRVFSPDELQRLVTLCRTYEMLLFCDEIHCDIVYPSARHTPLLSLPDAASISVVAHSIGKTFNTSGLQASFVMIPNPELRDRFARVAQRNHVDQINLMGKVAIEAVFSPEGQDYRQQLLTALRVNIEAVCEILATVPNLPVMIPDATFLVWCDFRAFGHWTEVQRRLVHDAGVGLSGGRFFGPAGEGWFRINCAHPRQRLLAAVEAIARTFS